MRKILLIIISLCLHPVCVYSAPDPGELLKTMDHVLRGDSHDMLVELHVQTERWERNYKIRVKMKGLDYAFARVLEPSKVEGQGFLRVKTRLWQYLPSAERTILIPPSLMLDQFMGSDFSNDDFVKMSYMATDYQAEMVGEENMLGEETYHLTLKPNPDAPVTYGKLEVWLRKSDSAPVKWEFYNEKQDHIRSLNFSAYRDFNGWTVPTVWDMENIKDPSRSTRVTILEAQYNLEISDHEFERVKLESYP